MTGFAQSLKSWRAQRRFSQLDLAIEAEVSSRHISFLETGRARPSREMILRLSEALHLPLSARNQLLTHAGFAQHYPGRDWAAAEMAPIRAAVERTLTQHMPYPGLAVDRLWRVKAMNPAAVALFGGLGLGVGGSLLDLMCSEALPPLVENWPEVAHHAAHRLRTESAAQGGIAALDETAEHLSKVPSPSAPTLGPVVPTRLRLGEMRLSLFATIAQFGTPEDLTLEDLKIELYFPADEDSAAALEALSPTAQTSGASTPPRGPSRPLNNGA